MAPTIRIDDEVYAWLQGNAKPFEDTPNSVLRRIAGLDNVLKKNDTPTEKQRREGVIVKQRELDAKTLNDKWDVGAKHALYHKDGRWFNNLERFPGALFDPQGYILFKTKEEYINCSYLRIGQETNVPKGISLIPGYVKVKS